MRATLSLLQAWLLGLGVFVAMTAAFFVALILAIAGPPTNDEVRAVRATANAALGDLSEALARAGEGLCARFPQTAGADAFCPSERMGVSAAPIPVRGAEAPPAAPAAPVEPMPVTPSEPMPELLGDNAQTVPVAAPARARHVTRHSRRARTRLVRRTHPHSAAIPRLAPIQPHPVTAPLAEVVPEAPPLLEMHPITTHPIVTPPPDEPAETEAAPHAPRGKPLDEPRQQPANGATL